LIIPILHFLFFVTAIFRTADRARQCVGFERWQLTGMKSSALLCVVLVAFA
jgi:hypothetical protein